MTIKIYGLDLWDQIRGIGSMDCLSKQYLHSNHNFSKVKQIALQLLQLNPLHRFLLNSITNCTAITCSELGCTKCTMIIETKAWRFQRGKYDLLPVPFEWWQKSRSNPKICRFQAMGLKTPKSIGCCAQNRPIVSRWIHNLLFIPAPRPVGISQRTICCCSGSSSFLAFLTVCGKFLPFAWFCDDGVSGLTSMNFYLTRSDVTNRGPLHDEPSKAGPDGELMNLSLSC